MSTSTPHSSEDGPAATMNRRTTTESSNSDDDNGEGAFAVQKSQRNTKKSPVTSPPTSPRQQHHRRQSSTIRRASLSLLPQWDEQQQSLRHLGDLDDNDIVQIAFFPEMPENIPDVSQDALPPMVAGNEYQQELKPLYKTSKKESAVTSTDDEWSTASVTSDNLSVYSSEEERTSSGIWQDVPESAPDAILGIAAAYKSCTHPNKVNVCVGAYRDDNGKPYVLPTVRKAEYKLLEDNENKEYLPIEGDKDFLFCAMKFAYGKDMDVDNHIATVQTLSGTGACTIGGKFLNEFYPDHIIYVPDPTWGNHIKIFKQCDMKVKKYRYYDRSSNSLDLQGMINDIQHAPDGSIILLHACAHNPTGCDPTMEEWKEIISLISNKSHIAFFDSAYQGFASGDAEQDAQAFRYAVSQQIPILLAQSFAKNFGLYGERVGTLSIVCGDKQQKQHIMSALRSIIRPMYSSPPRHGSSIVKTILYDPALKEEYYQQCEGMAIRIQKMRKQLVEALQSVGSTHDWSHITQQIGMFAYTGMNEDMCKRLTDEFFIFLTTNGRISMAGLNENNLQYVATAVHTVTDGQSIITN